MKSFKKLLMVVLTMFIAYPTLRAQEAVLPVTSSYNTAIGIRMGGLTSGLTIKQFIGGKSALEGIFSFATNSFVITGLYERHIGIVDAPGLNWVYGVGGHIGTFYPNGRYYYYRYYYYPERTNVLGIDGIFGLDYKFNKIPFNVGIDIKPFVDFYDGPFVFLDGALSLRFAF